MLTARLGIHGIGGSSPADTVLNYTADVGVIEASALLVTGLEVEYLTESSEVAAAGTENVTLLKPAGKELHIGLGNKERLAVHLFKQLEMLGNTLGNGV